MMRKNCFEMAFALCILCGCASDDLMIMYERNGQVAFDVSVIDADSMRIDAGTYATKSTSDDLFLPTSSIDLKNGDSTLFANCATSKVIGLHNEIGGSKTRGVDHTSSFYDSFGVYGYFYDNSTTWSANKSTLTPSASMNGIKVSKSGSRWLSGAYWPASNVQSTFFAYAPYNCTGTSITATSGAPQLTYTVPQDISKQEDLMVSKSAEDVSCTSNSSVPLSFSHALTAIKFIKGTLPSGYTISQISISGVYNQAIMDMDTKTWGSYSTTSGNSYTTTNINDMLLLLPQALPSTAHLSVTVNDGTTSKTFSQSLNGTTIWSAGTEVTYQLSITKITGQFIFTVEPSTTSISSAGGTVTTKVTSYYKFSDNTTTTIGWQGSYFMNGISYTINGDGSTTGETFEINIPANNNDGHTKDLRSRASANSTYTPYNLSNSTGASNVQNTANCYVIGRKGKYSLPLVYGNAIKNSSTNSSAYQTSSFVTHVGHRITNPYIYNNYTGGGTSGTKFQAASAALVWQDAKDLITYIGLSSDKTRLEFTVGDNLQQGNAILAVKDGSGVIMWSWHIWVTYNDTYIYTNTDEITAFDNIHKYKFMPVPIGWCDETFTENNINITVSQTKGSSSSTKTITQEGENIVKGNCPYYQWGRKDPFCPMFVLTKQDKTLYDINGNTLSFQTMAVTTTAGAIQNPDKFILGEASSEVYKFDWNNSLTQQYDLWNASNGTTTSLNYNEVTKSVYDPSPIGFKMPTVNAWTGFTDTGDATTNTSEYNVSGSFNYGYSFHTKPNRQGTLSFWSANGNRFWGTGQTNAVGTAGCYWSAGPHPTTNTEEYYRRASSVLFTVDNVNPTYLDAVAAGWPVRPCLGD